MYSRCIIDVNKYPIISEWNLISLQINKKQDILYERRYQTKNIECKV